ncbi:hypothetical protein NA78x_004132 [Anatilimnocola sp. NA78]|uniref:hypothetical protein n=1 Tax=Anatilimnocola sp. NA78 TaxID=3415683 RepID=UPI003CE53E89
MVIKKRWYYAFLSTQVIHKKHLAAILQNEKIARKVIKKGGWRSALDNYSSPVQRALGDNRGG